MREGRRASLLLLCHYPADRTQKDWLSFSNALGVGNQITYTAQTRFSACSPKCCSRWRGGGQLSCSYNPRTNSPTYFRWKKARVGELIIPSAHCHTADKGQLSHAHTLKAGSPVSYHQG